MFVNFIHEDFAKKNNLWNTKNLTFYNKLRNMSLMAEQYQVIHIYH